MISFGVAVGMVGLCILPLSMFIGLGAAASERSRNTLPFLQSLPAPLWRVAVIKVVFGLFSLLVAIALAIAFDRPPGNTSPSSPATTRLGQCDSFRLGGISGTWYVDCFIMLAPFAASVFAWSAAAGVNRRDEISAGAMAVVVVVGWAPSAFARVFLCSRVWFINIDHPHNRDKWTWLAVLALLDTSWRHVSREHQISSKAKPAISLALTCVTAATTYSLLLAWYVHRFGKINNSGDSLASIRRTHIRAAEWLSAPRAFPRDRHHLETNPRKRLRSRSPASPSAPGRHADRRPHQPIRRASSRFQKRSAKHIRSWPCSLA